MEQTFDLNFSSSKGVVMGGLKFKTIRGRSPSFSSPYVMPASPAGPLENPEPAFVEEPARVAEFEPYFPANNFKNPYNM